MNEIILTGRNSPPAAPHSQNIISTKRIIVNSYDSISENINSIA